MGDLEGRMGGLEGRMGGLEGRMGGLEWRMANVEQGMGAQSNKMSVLTESLRGDIQTVLETVIRFTDEMRRTTASVRKEHEADRRVLHLALENHGTRIAWLESDRGARDVSETP
jgi:hypothetical protein